MEKEKIFRLTGTSRIVDFSADGSLIIIGDHDGGFKVYDIARNVINCKTRLKGPRSDLVINNQDISSDNRYAAFSCLHKVFVMDISKKEVIREFDFSGEERQASVPFCLFRQSPQLLIPNGDNLLIHHIDTDESRSITLPGGAGWTDCVAVSPDDALVAYKSNNDGLDDRIFIYDARTGKHQYTIMVPYPSVRGRQVFICRNIRFVDNDTLLVLRKGIGLSYFRISTGSEILTRTWDDMGFKSVHSFWDAKISVDAHEVLFRAETPDPGYPDEWYVNVADGYEYVLYDIIHNKILFRTRLGESPACFHLPSGQLASIKTEYGKGRSRYLVIEEMKTT